MRSWRRNAFVLLAVLPLVLGTLTAIIDRFLPFAESSLRALLVGDSDVAVRAGLVLALLMTGIGLGASAELLFPRRGRALMLDLMPVGVGARFADAWLARVLGLLPLLAGLLVVALLVARPEGMPPASTLLAWAWRLTCVGIALAGLELVAVLILVRVRGWRPLVIVGLGALLLAAAILPASAASQRGDLAGAVRLGARVVLAPWAPPAAQIGAVLTDAVAVGAGSSQAGAEQTSMAAAAAAAPLLPVTAVGMLYALIGAGLALRWLRRERESALAQARGGPRRGGRLLDRLAARRIPALRAPAPRALWVRDLLLVLRRFSPAVDVAAIVAAAALCLATVTLHLQIATFWRSRFALLTISLAVLALAALVPFVLRHQLPRAWLERTSGVEPTAIWRAKLWLARALGLPAAVVGAGLLLTLGPGDLAARGLDAATALLAAWMITTIIGLACFEIAERPVVGLVFGGLVAGALVALLILYRNLAPAWIAGYFLLANTISDRATRRVRFTEVAR